MSVANPWPTDDSHCCLYVCAYLADSIWSALADSIQVAASGWTLQKKCNHTSFTIMIAHIDDLMWL